MPGGCKRSGGQPEDEHLEEYAQKHRQPHRCLGRYEYGPDHRDRERYGDAEPDPRYHPAADLEAPVTKGGQGAQLEQEAQEQVRALTCSGATSSGTGNLKYGCQRGK
jgi:hypothetical protein